MGALIFFILLAVPYFGIAHHMISSMPHPIYSLYVYGALSYAALWTGGYIFFSEIIRAIDDEGSIWKSDGPFTIIGFVMFCCGFGYFFLLAHIN